MNWSADHGAFINLRAFGNCEAFRCPGARLPSWQVIQRDYPHLIDASPYPERWFVSHRWDDGPGLEEPHPDPTGWQLGVLLELADHYNFDKPNLCFWYDYMSLPQKPRSGDEADLFARGLSHIRHVVAECQSVFLVSASGSDNESDLAEHLKRGWIVFELYIARSNIRIPLKLRERDASRVSAGRSDYGWDATVPSIHAIAPWDHPGHLEQWFDNRGIVCTNGADLAFLARELHDSLSRYPYSGRMPAVRFGERTVLTTSEIAQFAFINGCGLSPRRPDLFLKDSDFDPARHIWNADIQRRPPALSVGIWSALSPDEVTDRMIDPTSGRSPMYPGIRFEVSVARDAVRPTIE